LTLLVLVRTAAAGCAAAGVTGVAAVMLLSPLLMQDSECSKLTKAKFKPDKTSQNRTTGGLSQEETTETKRPPFVAACLCDAVLTSQFCVCVCVCA
jgi:hypothetical protein